ncbi:CLUMA_CG016383, isoform A [Clunio marinus]|uniref:Peroxisome biogenesis factor 2 n=1 Tax=Clunio marinus TaxID=568069 RepID=A0A1J1IRW5_9DIPT|nr:CLUMA_CG016383, isoform A [Clunio marinus]
MEKSSYVSRVNQLDADLLDKEVTKIIHEQLSNVYKELPPGILSKYQPEIDCLLKTIIWYCSILRNKSTFGQQILAITYQKDQLTRKKLLFHYISTILSSYLKDVSHLRLTNHLEVQKIIAWIECSTRMLTIINFFRFLKIGVYPSLVDYCLGWKHTAKSGTRMRNVGYDYMNRELIWTGFLEFLTVTLPLVNFHSMRRKITNALKPSVTQQHSKKQEPAMNINTKCAICLQRPSLPHHINCGHIFCYYCLKGSVLADPQFQCPLCDFSSSEEVLPVKIKI